MVDLEAEVEDSDANMMIVKVKRMVENTTRDLTRETMVREVMVREAMAREATIVEEVDTKMQTTLETRRIQMMILRLLASALSTETEVDMKAI